MDDNDRPCWKNVNFNCPKFQIIMEEAKNSSSNAFEFRYVVHRAIKDTCMEKCDFIKNEE